MNWRPWQKADQELDREIAHHLAELTDEYERRGMSRAEARARARAEFGGVDKFTEAARDEHRWRLLAEFAQDLYFGLRMLAKTPMVTAAAVLSLALGIGANTAIFSVMNNLLWRTLPVPAAEELGEILWTSKKDPEGLIESMSGSNHPEGPLQVADYFSAGAMSAFQNARGLPGEVAAHYDPLEVSARFAGTVVVGRLRPVSGNFFTMLRVQPALGRLLDRADDQESSDPVVVASHRFWETALGGRSDAAGQTIVVNNRSFVVAGVLPREFHGIGVGEASDLYSTLAHNPDLHISDSWLRKEQHTPTAWYLQLLGRRAPGVSTEAFQSVLQQVFASSWPAQPKSAEATPRIMVRDASRGLGSIRRNFGNPFSMLMAMVALVLVIACANVANLLLARAAARRQEVALRISLGSSRARLMRQFLTESALMATLGGLLSLAVAYGVTKLMVTMLPSDNGRLRFEAPLDWTTVLATLAAMLLTTLLFGLFPAWQATKVEAAPALKEGGGSSTAVEGKLGRWLSPSRLLVLGQVALGVVLVASAVAFTGRLRELVNRDAGFERTRLLLFDLKPGQTGYTGERLGQFYRELEAALKAVPEVERAAISRIRPMRGGGWWDRVHAMGSDKRAQSALHFVTADFLAAMGIQVLQGRGLTGPDLTAGASVAVLSEDLARELNLGVGARIKHHDIAYDVVGIARRAQYSSPHRQVNVLYLPNPHKDESFTVVLRTRVAPMQALAAVRQAVARLDRNLPLVNAISMNQQIARTLHRERMFAWLCGAFGALALVLCVVGLYGVMSYATTRRRREVGIRMALGASTRRVLRDALGEGMTLAALGLAVGAPLAYWASRWAETSMGIDPLILPALGWSAATLSVAAFLAVLIPARRAASADPLRALREG